MDSLSLLVWLWLLGASRVCWALKKSVQPGNSQSVRAKWRTTTKKVKGKWMGKEQDFVSKRSCASMVGQELVWKKGTRNLMMLINRTLFQQHKISLKIWIVKICLSYQYPFLSLTQSLFLPFPLRGHVSPLSGCCAFALSSSVPWNAVGSHKLDMRSVLWEDDISSLRKGEMVLLFSMGGGFFLQWHGSGDWGLLKTFSSSTETLTGFERTGGCLILPCLIAVQLFPLLGGL